MKITSLPQYYRHANRWRRILSVLSKYGLADWISRFDLDFAKGIFKDRDGEFLSKHTREARIRLTMSELGPAFIKLGQILSTRADLVGPELADELSQLQSHVPADPPEAIRELIEQELGRSIEDCFAEFSDDPLASASIGQVHAARLHSGTPVVVKVQHLNIEETVSIDLDIMIGLAELAETVPELSNYRPHAVVAEFQRMMKRELDFSREQRNMHRFHSDFGGNPTVCIPEPYPDFCSRRVLTMQRLEGAKLTELAHRPPLKESGAEIARAGAGLYLEMIFTHGFYHADPHPGNILILRDNVIGLLDYGMVGQIDQTLQEEMENLLIALANQDSEELTGVITRLGAVPPALDQAGLGLEVAEFVSHYGSLPWEEFDISSALQEMTELIRRYHIMLPARVAMLLKVFVMLEGTSRLLNPDFKLLELMRPYQRRMIWNRFAPGRQLRKAQRIFGEVERLVEILPRRLFDILQQIQTGKFDVHLDHRGLEPSVNRLVLGMMTSALFLGSSLLVSRNVPPLVFSLSVPGVLGIVMSMMLGLRIYRAINKSGHLDRRD